MVSLNKLGLPASGGGMAGVLFHNVAEWIATHPKGTTSNTAIKGYTLDDSHNLGTLTVKEDGFIRAVGPNGACLKEIGTLNLEDGYEYLTGDSKTRIVVPTADNPTNNTYYCYNTPDGARRYYFYDYEVPTPDNSIATGIDSVTNDQLHATGGTWYTLDGQQLNTKPTQKGIYLFKGKKVVVR